MALGTLVYDSVLAILSFAISIFFREVRARGSQNVPPYGPVIFVVAPHHNQFVDPILLMKTAKRRIGLLAAQKSMERRLVGGFAKAIGSIGVTRVQDVAVRGIGKVLLPDATGAPNILKILVSESESSPELKELGPLGVLQKKKLLSPGHSILFTMPKASGDPVPLEIEAIIDGTTLQLRRAIIDEKLIDYLKPGLGYKIAPKLEYNVMYDQVFERLRLGRCIGIFPEGGSHDRSTLLPFKAGVAIMALGAMAAHPGLDVKLVPVGLSYFHADKFRSRAAVEYGAPISISPELVEQYIAGGTEKRVACQSLLDVVQAAVANVTVTAPDYNTLMVCCCLFRTYHWVFDEELRGFTEICI
jgi:glycerol-3-phosphate O-acyltransferase/dihydroxyacetone phosphate acyltransferase